MLFGCFWEELYFGILKVGLIIPTLAIVNHTVESGLYVPVGHDLMGVLFS